MGELSGTPVAFAGLAIIVYSVVIAVRAWVDIESMRTGAFAVLIGPTAPWISRGTLQASAVLGCVIGIGVLLQGLDRSPGAWWGVALLGNLVLIVGLMARDLRRYERRNPQTVRRHQAEPGWMDHRAWWAAGLVAAVPALVLAPGEMAFLLLLPLSLKLTFELAGLATRRLLGSRFSPPHKYDFIGRRWSDWVLVLPWFFAAFWLALVLCAAFGALHGVEPDWPWPLP